MVDDNHTISLRYCHAICLKKKRAENVHSNWTHMLRKYFAGFQSISLRKSEMRRKNKNKGINEFRWQTKLAPLSVHQHEKLNKYLEQRPSLSRKKYGLLIKEPSKQEMGFLGSCPATFHNNTDFHQPAK